MAREFPQSRFRGFDFSEEAIGRARAEARRPNERPLRRGRTRPRFDERRGVRFHHHFDAIHDQADPARVLRNIHGALRRDGTYLMQDISGTSHLDKNIEHPLGPFLYTISTMHCMTVSLARAAPGWARCGAKRPATRMLREAGFTRISTERLAHDFQNLYFVIRKD